MRSQGLGDRPIRISSNADDLEGTHLWKQPFVTTHCTYGYPPRQFTDGAAYDGTTRYAFMASGNSTVYVSMVPRVLPRSSPRGTSAIIIPRQGLSSSPAASFSAALAFQTGNATALCLIGAQWLEAQDTFITLLQPGNIPDFAVAEPDLGLGLGLDQSSGIPITLTQDWLEAFDRGGAGAGSGSGSGYFARLSRMCRVGSDSDAMMIPPEPSCLAAGLSIGISEGLSLAMDAHDTYYFGPDGHQPGGGGRPLYRVRTNADLHDLEPVIMSDAQLANFTHVRFDMTHTVYAYSLDGVTVWLALVVLFLYVATVMVHMLVVLLCKTWSSSALSSQGELLELALLLPELKLRTTKTGEPGNRRAMTNRVWSLRASVEEVPVPGSRRAETPIRARLVVRDDGDRRTYTRPTRPDVVYSY